MAVVVEELRRVGAIVHDRVEWQQRIRAVLYHHGLPARPELQLLRAHGRGWLESLAVPEIAGEQIALAVINALDARIAPVTAELQAYARRQTGCRR